MSDNQKIERFREMTRTHEKEMNDVDAMVKNMQELIAQIPSCLPALDNLSRWYFKGTWLQDHAFEQKNPIKDEPCGVYSEDGLYNLFDDVVANSVELHQLLDALTSILTKATEPDHD